MPGRGSSAEGLSPQHARRGQKIAGTRSSSSRSAAINVCLGGSKRNESSTSTCLRTQRAGTGRRWRTLRLRADLWAERVGPTCSQGEAGCPAGGVARDSIRDPLVEPRHLFARTASSSTFSGRQSSIRAAVTDTVLRISRATARLRPWTGHPRCTPPRPASRRRPVPPIRERMIGFSNRLFVDQS